MKKVFAVFVALLAVAAQATSKTDNQGNITIQTTKVCRMLVQTWADAYMKENPQTHIVVADTKSDRPSDIVVTTEQSGAGAASVGRYILLPVTTDDNPVVDELQSKQLSQYDLSLLYFEQDPYADEDEEVSARKRRLIERVTVYSGNRRNSAAEEFARIFGHKSSDLRGKKIGGDDIYLLSAIERDSTGITVGNAAYLYNTDSRLLKNGLVVLPVKLKKEQRQAVESRNLDQLLKAFEEVESDILPARDLSLELNSSTPAAKKFAQWVHTAGQHYNNQAGFLRAAGSHDLASN